MGPPLPPPTPLPAATMEPVDGAERTEAGFHTGPTLAVLSTTKDRDGLFAIVEPANVEEDDCRESVDAEDGRGSNDAPPFVVGFAMGEADAMVDPGVAKVPLLPVRVEGNERGMAAAVVTLAGLVMMLLVRGMAVVAVVVVPTVGVDPMVLMMLWDGCDVRREEEDALGWEKDVCAKVDDCCCSAAGGCCTPAENMASVDCQTFLAAPVASRGDAAGGIPAVPAAAAARRD